MSDLKIINKIIVTPAQQDQWCFNFDNTGDSFAYSVNLNEGISIPFKAVITVLSEKKVSRLKLYDLLGKYVTFALSEQNQNFSSEKCKYVRQYEGIVTKAVFKGLLQSVLTDSDELKTGYRYELTVESELVKLGVTKRVKIWTSDKSVKDIINEIFKSYNMEAVIPQKLFSQEDDNYALLKNSGFSFEQNETDLDFINRLCKNFSLNYTQAYEEESHTPPKFLVHFSRSYNTLPNLPVYTSEDLKTHTMTPSKNGDIYFLFQTTLSAKADEIFEKPVVFSAEYESEFNESCFESSDNEELPLRLSQASGADNNALSVAKELQTKYRISEVTKARINSRAKALFTAGDLQYCPGVMLTVKEDDDDVNQDDKWIVVRECLGFYTNYPQGRFGENESLSQNEGKVELTLGCIPQLLNDKDPLDSLGAMCLFDRLHENEPLSEGLKYVKKASEHAQINPLDIFSHNLQTFEGVVSDLEGNTADDEVKKDQIIPKDANSFYPNKFYVKLSNCGIVVIANYVSDRSVEDYANSIPKPGRKVLVLFSDNRYYFLGYLSNAPAFDSYSIDLIKEKQTSDSLAGFNDDGASLDTDFTGIEVANYNSSVSRIKDSILKGTISLGIIAPLSNFDNTFAYSDFFTRDSYTLKLLKVSNTEDIAVINDDQKTDTYQNCCSILVDRIVSDRKALTEYASSVRKQVMDNEDSQKAEAVYNLYKQSLSNDLEVLNKLAADISDNINNIKQQLGLPEF